MDHRVYKVPNDSPFKFQDKIKQAKFDQQQLNLVLEICGHVGNLNDEIRTLKGQLQGAGSLLDEPAGKKRKLDTGVKIEEVKRTIPLINTLNTIDGMAWILSLASLEAQDISLVAPQRKKSKVTIRPGSTDEDGGITTEAVGGKLEDNLAIRWKDIEQIICTAVPEKASPACNFTIIPSAASAQASVPLEPIIFTVPQTAAKNVTFHSGGQVQEGEKWDQLFRRVLDKELRRFGKKVAVPDPKGFESTMVQAHRKGEKAYHVKAFRGATEGFLFLLESGILFGFRKPVLFFPLHSITSISYSSVLQRTFNLNISVQLRADDSTFFIKGAPMYPKDPPTEADYEFSMVDQADHNGIDQYVRGHGLNDASLAEGRRAKKYNVNKHQVKPGTNGAVPAANGVVGEEEEESEIAKAERELQDAEDEEEEDYEDEGGDSDGSGTDSEEEVVAEGYEEAEDEELDEGADDE